MYRVYFFDSHYIFTKNINVFGIVNVDIKPSDKNTGIGFDVDFVGEATLTFPMTDVNGREWSAAEIRARTELVLAGRFARIATVEQALEGIAEQKAA